MSGIVTTSAARREFAAQQISECLADFKEYGPTIALDAGIDASIYRFDDKFGGEDGLVVFRREDSNLVEIATIRALASRLSAKAED